MCLLLVWGIKDIFLRFSLLCPINLTFVNYTPSGQHATQPCKTQDVSETAAVGGGEGREGRGHARQCLLLQLQEGWQGRVSLSLNQKAFVIHLWYYYTKEGNSAWVISQCLFSQLSTLYKNMKKMEELQWFNFKIMRSAIIYHSFKRNKNAFASLSIFNHHQF